MSELWSEDSYDPLALYGSGEEGFRLWRFAQR